MKKTSRPKNATPPSASKRGPRGHWISEDDFSVLHANLAEAQETLEAIRSGAVDAVVVNGPHGNQIYSLSGADQPYRVYVERMQEGAVTISRDDVILYANRRFADMVGKPLEQVIGTDITAYLDKMACEKIHGVFQNQNEAVKYEAALQAPNKPPLPVYLTAGHLPLQDQNVVCLVVTDLSAQKQNEVLRMAKEVAEKANQAKDDFLAALSHELRTPLNPVLLLASEGAEDPELSARTRADFATMRDNIELEARLIDDLLDVTRISKGKLQLSLETASVHEILQRSYEICREEIAAKDLKIEFRLRAEQAYVEGDPARLQQVFWNLIKNSVKFTPAKGRIVIETLNSTPDKVEIRTTDTGIGIESDQMERIFNAFEQGQSSITRRFGGLGLGLAISKAMVNAHGGTIRAESSGKNRGATFTVTLATVAAPAVAPAIPKSHGSKAAALKAAQVKGSGPRVLVVDDHVDTCTGMKMMLERRGYRVTLAHTADQAVEKTEREEFDLVISDIGLPDRSGYELMQELSTTKGLRGIALSGFGMENDVSRARAAGFSEHLTKPINFDRLDEAIQMLLSEPEPAVRS